MDNTTTRNWPLLRTYAALVVKKVRTIDQVPEEYRSDVQAIINGTIAE